jgi:pyruvate/2-oxoglutarate dehydrogenase complex dihydrolipoamide acyltransferase (E2) component
MAGPAALPRLPSNPLGDLPDNPLGAAPSPPIIGRREPLRLPLDRLRARRGGSGGGRAPLPSLNTITRRTQPRPAAPTPAPVTPAHPQPAPITIAPRPAAPAAPPAPRAQTPPQGARTPARTPARRRSAAQVRDEARDHLRALYGPQIADHPALGHADIRRDALRGSAAYLRGHLAQVHAGGHVAGQAHKQNAQRANPGFTPRDPHDPAASPQPEPGMPPAVRARRAAQYAAMRDDLAALRRPPQAPGGQA